MGRELHSIANVVITNLVSLDGVHHKLGSNGVERVARALERLFDTPELRSAVRTLISMAKTLEDAGSIEGASQLLAVANIACDSLRTLGASAAKLAEDVGEMTTRVFRRFNGGGEAKSAPKLDEKPMPGTISVASLTATRPRRA